MLPYFLVAGFIATLAFTAPQKKINPALWAIALLGLVVFIGLRHHVGMDWNNYLIMIGRAGHGSYTQALLYAEPAYAFLLWASAKLGFGIYGTNFVTTLIFCAGLFRYARTTPSPWTALMVSLPMLVIVVAMSANRQAVAIGVILWVIASWPRHNPSQRVLGILCASLFHTSALFFLAFALAELRLPRMIKLGLGLISFLLIIAWLQYTGLAEYYDSLYLSGQSDLTRSEGALLHIFFNAGPALLFFVLPHQLQQQLLPNALHRKMALLAIVLLPTALFASTAAGRLSLYLFPVSMYFFASLPKVMHSRYEQHFMRYVTIVGALGLIYLWLGFSNSSIAHIPYGNLLTTPVSAMELCCDPK